MSYDEHLISMAGGDGDLLDQIQRRADKTREHHATGNSFPLDADKDRDTLLALVREQQARIDLVANQVNASEALCRMNGRDPDLASVPAAAIRAALEPAP